MNATSLVTCPNCGYQFNSEQILAKEVENKLRHEYNQKFKLLKEQNEIQLKKILEEERILAEENLKKRFKEQFDFQLKAAQEELERKSKQIQEMQQRELQLLQKEKQLYEEKQAMEIKIQRQLLEERKLIEEQARKKSDEENQLKLREKDLLLEQLQKNIDDMKKKSEQGSMQVQGEVQEIALEEMLASAFPLDTIRAVGKGIKGADIEQIVRNKLGHACGTILYESKRTKSFSNEWIEKLKTDLRSKKADIAIIVTETYPKDLEHFGQKEGIWICNFQEAKAVASLLREGMLQVYHIRHSQTNKGDKMQMLYEFLTSNEFRQHMEAIVEGFTQMQLNLNKERLAMEKIWSEREKQIMKVLTHVSGMYGSFKGIAGSAVADVKLLELDTDETLKKIE